jgi:nitroimidazol reductase NimA-like FMN-containing flavoprotein (pyridoxamine 5'-phosphate oxidase superfamily)
VSSYGFTILDDAECAALLPTQRVGRVAVTGEHVGVYPVVYAVLDGDVVFRTAPGEKLIAAVLHRPVTFEVDDYDPERRSGWSVNVVGTPREIVNPDELERAHGLDLPAWAGEVRDHFVRIETTTMTGRRLGNGSVETETTAAT